MKKILLVLLDGIGDRIYRELGERTPLEAADTPNLDRVAAAGASAAVYPIEPGLVPPSELAHFHLFGYADDPFPGRAVLESLGFGVAPPRDTAVAHLGLRHVTPSAAGFAIAPWWPGAEEDDARALAAAIAEFTLGDIRLQARYLGRSDSLLVMHGASEHVTDSDPFMHTGQPVLEVAALASAPDADRARATAAALNAYLRWAHAVLSAHPVNRRRAARGRRTLNMPVTKWPGRYHALAPFRERCGLRGTIIASATVYAGIAAALGMDYREVTEDLADPARELADKLAVAREAFAGGAEFVHLHTKAADEAAHRHSPQAKRDAIAALDRGLAGLWDWPALGDLVVAVTADHATPSRGPMLHSGESVPLAVVGEGVRRDRVERFSERDAVLGTLGQLRGRDVLPVLLNAADRARFLGGRATAGRGIGLPDVIPLGAR